MGPFTTPIPQRIPPLTWRQPVLVWTPAALVLALGWPGALLAGSGLSHIALIGGAVVFALSFVSMGAAWLLGRPPRTRRDVVVHMLGAGALVCVAAPFVTLSLLDAVADGEHIVTGLRPASAYAMTPLALLIGLPIALFFGLVFSFVGLVKQVSAIPPARRIRDTGVGKARRRDVARSA